MFDLAKLKLDPPKLYDDKPDWDLFLHTLTSVIGVTNPQVLSIIPGFEDHPFVKQINIRNYHPIDPSESPLNEPFLSPKREEPIKGVKEEQVDDEVESVDAKAITGSKISKPQSIATFAIPTELKSEVPIVTGGSKPTIQFSSQYAASYYEALEKQKKDSLKRILFAYLLQACSHDRRVMTIMKQGGTDGVECFKALQKHYGGLELVKFQEDQQAIYYSYPRKVKDVSTWLAAYLNLVDKQEKRMQAPIPLLMKADMIMNKLKHLPPFARYYENNWQALLPNQRPPWDEFLQIVQQIAQGNVSMVRMQKLYGTGNSRSDPITVNLVGGQNNRNRIRCFNCEGDHVMKMCLVRCTLRDCPRDGHDPNNCPLRRRADKGTGQSRGTDESTVNRESRADEDTGKDRRKGVRKTLKKKKGREKEDERGKSRVTSRYLTSRGGKERRKLKAADFIKKKKAISLNAGGSDSSSSSSSEEEEEEESDSSERQKAQHLHSSDEDSDSDKEMDDVGHINHMYSLNMMEKEGEDEGGDTLDDTPPPPPPLFAPSLTPLAPYAYAPGRTSSRDVTLREKPVGRTGPNLVVVKKGETTLQHGTTHPTHTAQKQRIPPLSENDFQTSLEMAGDPTPLGVIYTLEDGWGLRRIKSGYRKILIKNTNPLHIREINGPPLNLHAKPIKSDTCHVPSGKQCEATTNSGFRCQWKLGAARLEVEGGQCAARLEKGFDFCEWHIPQELKRVAILAGYRTKLRSGFIPPSNSYMLLPMTLLSTQWKRIPDLAEEGTLADPSSPIPLPLYPSIEGETVMRDVTLRDNITRDVTLLTRDVTREREEGQEETISPSVPVPVSVEKGTQGGEHDEQGDIAWHWDKGKKVIVGGNGEVPPPAEMKRFLQALAEGARELTVKDSLITNESGEVDDFYNDIFAAVHECIVSLALKHNNQFARGMVASFPFLSDFAKDCIESDKRWEGKEAQHAQNHSILPTPESLSSSISQSTPLPESSHHKHGQDACSIMMVEDEGEGDEEVGEDNMVWIDDSGASESQSPHKASFVRMKHDPQRFRIAKGSLKTEYKGKVEMRMSGAHGDEVCVTDSHTTYNPHLKYGLVATSAWVKRGLAVVHQNNQVLVIKKPIVIEEDQVVVRGRSLPNNLSVFDPPGMPPLNPNEWYEPSPLRKQSVKVENDDSSSSTITF